MLGGHISRSHPGQSKDYRLKLQTRKEREPERNAHKEAKKIFEKENPGLDAK
jgi:hypothetical protein